MHKFKTTDERSASRAEVLLKRLKPFEEWSQDKDAVASAERISGMTARDFYDMFVKSLKWVASGEEPKVIVGR